MTMTTHILLRRLRPVLLGVFLTLVPLAAGAQNDTRLDREIEKTESVLREAARVVQHAVGARPEQLLDQARNLQGRARDIALDPDSRPGDFLQAGHFTLDARRLAIRAADLARAEIRLLDRVRNVLAENHDLLARARDAVRRSENAEAERLLQGGVQQLDRGQRAFDQGHYRQAVRFSLFGRDLVDRALRLAQGDRGADAARVREAVDRTEEFLREARAARQDHASAEASYREAERLQEEARRHLEGGRAESARRLTLRARVAALDVLRHTLDRPERADVVQALERVESRLQELRPRAQASADEKVLQLVAEAEDHLDRARGAEERGDHGKALAEILVASSLVSRADGALR
jgi:hypothetical protein